MKSNMIASFILITLALASSGVVASEKMTYEKAMKSHKETYGKYAEQSITEEQSQKSWDDHEQKPHPSESTSETGLKKVWSGHATTVTNRWGDGAFLVQLADPYRPNDTVASLWLMVDGSTLQRSSAVSMYGYEKSWFVEYKNGTFYGVGVRESTPSIKSISKQKTTNN